MALEIARAVQTPLPPPDISSPSRSFAKRSFINSTSVIRSMNVELQEITITQKPRTEGGTAETSAIRLKFDLLEEKGIKKQLLCSLW